MLETCAMAAPLGRPWRWLPEGCRTTPVKHAGTVCWPGSAYRARAAKVSATQLAMKVLSGEMVEADVFGGAFLGGEDFEKHEMSFCPVKAVRNRLSFHPGYRLPLLKTMPLGPIAGE